MFVDEKAVGEKQPVKLGTLKLSEAIRIGAAKRPKCQGLFNDGGSCAIGAAYEAFGGDPASTLDDTEGAWHFICQRISFDEYTEIYSDEGRLTPLWEEIYMRNDGDGRKESTREEIADWLESQGY